MIRHTKVYIILLISAISLSLLFKMDKDGRVKSASGHGDKNMRSEQKIKHVISAQPSPLHIIPDFVCVKEGGIVEANIKNNIEYEAFIEWLNMGGEYSSLFLNLKNTYTAIYLDQIVENTNITYVSVRQGGEIMCNNLDILKEKHMEGIFFYHIYGMQEGIIENFGKIDRLNIMLKSTYTGYIPIEELLLHLDCEKASIWYDWQRDEEESVATLISYEESKEWKIKEKLMELLSDTKRQLKAVYRLLGDEHEYISYEFKEADGIKVYLCIENRVSKGDSYIQWISLPIRAEEYNYLEGERLRLEDLNFDGYEDILFIGDNNTLKLYRECQGFLWNEEEKKYKYSETLPINFDRIDEEKKRITYHISEGIMQDHYYIYEYVEGKFIEKYLQVLLGEGEVEWKYAEDGRIVQKMTLFQEESEEGAYMFFNLETGQIIEGIWEAERYYYELGKLFFPEFDFYFLG